MTLSSIPVDVKFLLVVFILL